ncbi:MAG: VanW family protein [Clostridia bacterium]|nr:VanW family protein [Clostridia bacterium]
MTRKLISQRHPLLYFLAVWYKRINRYLYWFFGPDKYSKQRLDSKLSYCIMKHESVLIKKLGASDITLQYNKVKNLRIATEKINGILIKPGETFSFCRLVGRPTVQKGYLPGLELSFGDACTGIGGGLCQIANMLHWLILHSELTVIERHHHSFDPFPDDHRVVPFGTGATLFYNYVDFRFKNKTPHTYQINLWLSEEYLEGELRINTEPDHTYQVFEKNHRFLRANGEFYRQNEIWRSRISKKAIDEVINTELILKNFARVKYIPESYEEAGERSTTSMME